MRFAKTRYAWSPGAVCQGDPQKVGVALDKLRDKKNGQLKPSSVVLAARNPKSPLRHAVAWDWNDTVAANKWRESQAQYLIRHVHVIIDHDDKPHEVRAFVNVTPNDDDRAYMTIADVLNDEALRKQMIARAKTELESWARRYQDLVEFADVFDAIAELRVAAE